MTSPRIIALCGPHGCGKSEVAKALREITDALICPFADQVRRLARDRFGWDGEKDARGIALLEAITLAREDYEPGGWAEGWRYTFPDSHALQGRTIIADDLRLPSFLPMLARYESYAFAIRRFGYTFGAGRMEQITTGLWFNIDDGDALTNDSTPEDCARRILAAIERGEGRVKA